MSKKENLSETIKTRYTPTQRIAIRQTAQQEYLSESEIIRHSIFSKDTTSPYAIKVQRNLIKNEIRNTILFLDIPSKTKEKIIKELSLID
jgi:hypothetical protein